MTQEEINAEFYAAKAQELVKRSHTSLFRGYVSRKSSGYIRFDDED